MSESQFSHSFYYFIFMCMFGYIVKHFRFNKKILFFCLNIFFKEPDMLTGEENMEME